MATQVPMATPGLLQQPMPYVNLGLLAPQGQAQRLQAPAPSLGQAPDALGGLGEGAQALGQNLMQMAQAQREAGLQAQRANLLGLQMRDAQLSFDQKSLAALRLEADRSQAQSVLDAVEGVTQFTQPMTTAMANGARAVRAAQNNARVPTAPALLAAPRLPVATEPLSAPQGALDAATQQAMQQEADSLGVPLPSLPLDPALVAQQDSLVAQQDYGSVVPTATSRLSATPQADTVDALSGDVVPYRSADEEYAALADATPENADAVLAATTDEEVSVRNRLASLPAPVRAHLKKLTPSGSVLLGAMIGSSINSDNPLEGYVNFLKLAGEGSRDDIQQMASLRKDLDGISKPFIKAQTTYNKLLPALEGRGGVSDFMLLKLAVQFVEEGVVMEGEKRSFQDTSGFLEKLLTQMENVKNGASLNDAQRKEISSYTSKVYSSLIKEQKRIEKPFQENFSQIKSMSLLNNPVTFTSRINPDLVRSDGSVVVANFEKREQARQQAGETAVPVGGKDVSAAKLTPENIKGMTPREVENLAALYRENPNLRAALPDNVVTALNKKLRE